MSSRAVLVLASLLGVALAGCLGANLDSSSVGGVAIPTLLAQKDSLWPDHQNEPHPAYGWPTLTHPAIGASCASGEGTTCVTLIPEMWKPIPAANVTKVTGLQHVAKGPATVVRGAGTSLFGSLAIVPGFGESSSIVDIRDPAHPELLGQTEKSNVSHRGSSVIAYPNGTLVALFSTSYGMQAFDITDPAKPTLTADVHLAKGHKLGVVPGTPIVYNANSVGGAQTLVPGAPDPENNLGPGKGWTDILDFSDPWHPLVVNNFTNGNGCHHIFFWNDASKDKFRAICAGIQYTQIWDTKDPIHPKVIVSVPMHHGNPLLPSTSITGGAGPARLSTFSHTAMLSLDGRTLIVGDEFQGGGAPAECDGSPLGPGGPVGNLWFYDVTDEKSPQLKGYISPPPQNAPEGDTTTGCTAHHGRLVPDPEGKRQLLVMAWYKAGVLLIDFTNPSMPKIVDQYKDGTNTWEAWYDNGWVITGDLKRGMDVLKLK